MLRRKWLWFSVAFIILLIVMAPASLLSGVKSNAINLDDVQWSGRLWSGQAADITVNNAHLAAVQWSVRWSALFTGTLAADVRTLDPSVQVSSKVFWQASGWRFEPLTGTVDASWLAKLLNAGVQLRGAMQFDFQRLAGNHKQVTAADGTLHWQEAVLKTPFVQRHLPLGDLTLAFSTTHDHIGFTLTSGAPMRFDIRGTLEPSGAISLSGTMAATTLPEIDGVMQMFTQGYDGGKRVIAYQGRIPGW